MNTNDNIFIKITNAYVSGIDVLKRADSLKNFIVQGGKLFATEIPILHNINFCCSYGEKIAFIGGNGSGKSSLLKLIAGIYPLHSGTINVSGKIAAIIDMGVGFEPEMTGRQNIKILMLYNGLLEKYTKLAEEEIIDFSELRHKIDLPLKTYSSGMISRLAFSISIFQEPDILLLDEIFASGDKYFVEKSLTLMKNKFNNVPISILVSHQESLIKENCNRCILLKDGQIIADNTTDTVFKIYNSA